MGFLKRLLGGSPAPARPVTQLPEDGYLQVAGTIHHMGNLGPVLGRRDEALIEDVPALLVRDPRNAHDPNAVEVWIYGVTVGYLPREIAPAWNPSIAEIEAAGETAGIGAHLWYRWSSEDEGPNAYVNVRLSPKPLPPRADPNAPREYANTTCPYCGVEPARLLEVRTKCKTCGNVIHVRKGPDGLSYLLQKADLPAMEQAWAEHHQQEGDGAVRLSPGSASPRRRARAADGGGGTGDDIKRREARNRRLAAKLHSGVTIFKERAWTNSFGVHFEAGYYILDLRPGSDPTQQPIYGPEVPNGRGGTRRRLLTLDEVEAWLAARATA